jgi:triosephosphate isomerase
MTRRPFIVGNWKMHLMLAEAVELAREVMECCTQCPDRDVMIIPPFTALASVCAVVNGTGLLVGAQNIAWENKGAYTGEISPTMLNDLGVRMAIVGHSERRHIFGEDDVMINRRIHGALRGGIQPILCIGETLDERDPWPCLV